MSSKTAESIRLDRPFGVGDAKMGMWLFLISEIMFFGAMIGSYIVLRLGYSEGWPHPSTVLSTPVLAFNTFVLITSSLTMVLGLEAIQRGDVAGLRKNLLYTMAGGALFLVIKLADYAHMIHNGFTISANLFGSFYYMLTGFHGLHVLAGIVLMAVMYFRARRGDFSRHNWEAIEATGLYWHFVDLVWIILFAILCLV